MNERMVRLMSKATQWAKTVSEHMQTRPSFSTSLESIGGAQTAGKKEMAYVISVNGVAYLQLRGGMLSEGQAIELLNFLKDVFHMETAP